MYLTVRLAVGPFREASPGDRGRRGEARGDTHRSHTNRRKGNGSRGRERRPKVKATRWLVSARETNHLVSVISRPQTRVGSAALEENLRNTSLDY